MADPRNTLKSKFDITSRFNNYGSVIVRVVIKGFRCHKNTIIDVRSPIVAFCGMNGTGKSTILQVLSTAYHATGPNWRTFYMRDFFLKGPLDQTPYDQNASVVFHFWQQDRSTRQLTISKSSNGRQGWYGYKRRSTGGVFFGSIGTYIPKIEQKDFVARYYPNLTIGGSTAVDTRVRDCSCLILSQSYTGMTRNTMQYNTKNGELLTVARDGTSYSEIHMGFGEARSQYLVKMIESLPDKSLILLEEPETSLHPAAQFELGRYLIDVSIQKGHQIFLTTHSEALLRALPDTSRVYLFRDKLDVKIIEGLSSGQAHSLMTNGHDKALTILVEDRVSKAILCELIRTVDQTFLASTHIGIGGDEQEIARTVRGLKNTGLKVAAVRDGDKGDAPSDNVFKLPGTKSPEEEMFECSQVGQFLLDRYQVVIADFVTSLVGLSHHEWFDRLASRCSVDESALIAECARVYSESLSELDRTTLVNLMKESAH